MSSGLAQGDFERVPGFPGADLSAYGIAVQALPSGLFLVWDGNGIHRQTLVGGEDFDVIASGYEGDPAFMALSPDGHTVLLGGGMRPLMLFDVNNPVDYTPAAVLSDSISQWWGVFLTEDLILIDKGTDDWTTELVIVDITEETPVAETVMYKPAADDLGVGEYAASCALAVDPARTTVYCMSNIYVFDPDFEVVSNEMKSISVSALINAYQDKAILDWNSDPPPSAQMASTLPAARSP